MKPSGWTYHFPEYFEACEWYPLQIQDWDQIGHPSDAAEQALELRFAQFSFPGEAIVLVKDSSGIVSRWSVRVEAMPHFIAQELPNES